jgi:CBS domain containing-hemolysin-like protein
MVGAVLRSSPGFRMPGFPAGHAQVMKMVAIDVIRTARSRLQSAVRVALGTLIVLLVGSREAHASFLSPELEDKLATFLALFILFIVPIVLIVLFWMVHVLPEKIAHKRHHPQFEAIRTLCLLSLVFGGLLWPFAWLWAYSKPVFYKMAYGADQHPDALGHAAEEPSPTESLQERLARLESRVPANELAPLRADLAALEAKFNRTEVA